MNCIAILFILPPNFHFVDYTVLRISGQYMIATLVLYLFFILWHLNFCLRMLLWFIYAKCKVVIYLPWSIIPSGLSTCLSMAWNIFLKLSLISTVVTQDWSEMSVLYRNILFVLKVFSFVQIFKIVRVPNFLVRLQFLVFTEQMILTIML